MKIKTYADLLGFVLNILPDASFDTDNDGQVIIYTNIRYSGSAEALVDPECLHTLQEQKADNSASV
tara:strand:- start:549 stop:746 length:198 start_codon:yes stop_codon:yes gene_type:complete